MASDSFVHLHVHSEYSLLDGAARISDLAATAQEFGMPALALTDHGNMFGTIEFYQACREEGIKPIIGCEVYMAPGSRFDQKAASAREASTHFLLLAKDDEGYHNLIQLVTAAHLEGFYYKPRIDKEILAQYAKGLIGTSACLKGEIPQHILQEQIDLAKKSIDEFKHIFAPGDFYLELQDHGVSAQKTVNRELRKLAKDLNLPLLATNDVHYVKKEQASAHDVLLCIGTNANLHDEKRMRYPSPEFYFKSSEEMAALFADTPEALSNTLAVAEKCNLTIELGVNKFPAYPPPEGKTREQYLRDLCQDGMKKRFGEKSSDTELQERLEYELGVLEKTGFISYFLIVWDFIHYAKQNRIPVGPGRGSAAGSLISYVLEITDLDPLRYGLFFERFLNPERVSPPDIDVDFCYNRRPEVIDYVRKKYGERSVAQIITFGTLGAKMVVRDVARVLGLSYGEADRLAKMIPFHPSMTLTKAFKENPEFKKAYDEEEQTREIIDYAQTLEGLSRQTGVHAAGVVIADGDLTRNVPLTRDDSGGIVTQYAMGPLGDVGVLKMDFLGLKTLTVVQDCFDLIQENTGKLIGYHDIPLDDGKTYDLLSRGQNIGVFQVESAGMCDVCRRVKPRVLEDIIALVALYRPGPMEFIPLYGDRKSGKVPLDYDHPLLEPILKETYGIMVYQEQVMQAAQVIAGYSLGGADLLRRAMGKKKPEEMAKQRQIFVKGAKEKNNIPADQANKLFDVLDKFAGYGFNKAHAACYGYLAYITAWLKANYPVQFMTALLSNDMDNTDKIALFIQECKHLGLPVLPPCVNHSQVKFSVENHGLRYGLAAIKNVGSAAVMLMIEARQAKGPFKSVADLCSRVESRGLNKKLVESLAKAGAFDCLGLTRAQAAAEVDSALAQASVQARDRASGQTSLLDMLGEAESQTLTKSNSTGIAIPEWPVPEKLAYEKELLGLYFSGHPLDDYLPEIEALQIHQVTDLAQASAETVTRLAGLITKVEVRVTQKDKKPWAKYLFEDQSGATEIIAFPDTYAALTRAYQAGEIVVVTGTVNKREEPVSLRANQIQTLDEAREKFYQALIVDVPLAQWNSSRWEQLRQTVVKHPGKLRLRLRLHQPDEAQLDLEAGDEFNLAFTPELKADLKKDLGLKDYSLIASRDLPKPKPRPQWKNGGGFAKKR